MAYDRAGAVAVARGLVLWRPGCVATRVCGDQGMAVAMAFDLLLWHPARGLAIGAASGDRRVVWRLARGLATGACFDDWRVNAGGDCAVCLDGVSEGRPEIPARLVESRIVAILRRTDPDAAVATAEALVRGGIPTLEVTCDSPGAVDMIRAIGQAVGERALVGAGTVLDAATAQAALDAGARFLVSPHIDAALVSSFAQRGVPWIPGAFTATEVLTAWRAGAVVVKLFPAGAVGPGYIKDLLGPLRHIPLLPTGGVTLDNAASFIQAGAWGLGMGSALVSPQLVSAARFDELEARARRLTQAVAAARTAT